MKKFLIIQDDPVEANVLESRLKSVFQDCICKKVVGATSSALLLQLNDVLLHDRFDGSLLDIIYSGERTGGITLWHNLTDSQRRQCGKMVVVTKDAPEADLKDFVRDHAGGRKIISYVEEIMSTLLRSYFSPQAPPSHTDTARELEELRSMIVQLSRRVDRLERIDTHQ